MAPGSTMTATRIGSTTKMPKAKTRKATPRPATRFTPTDTPATAATAATTSQPNTVRLRPVHLRPTSARRPAGAAGVAFMVASGTGAWGLGKRPVGRGRRPVHGTGAPTRAAVVGQVVDGTIGSITAYLKVFRAPDDPVVVTGRPPGRGAPHRGCRRTVRTERRGTPHRTTGAHAGHDRRATHRVPPSSSARSRSGEPCAAGSGSSSTSWSPSIPRGTGALRGPRPRRPLRPGPRTHPGAGRPVARTGAPPGPRPAPSQVAPPGRRTCSRPVARPSGVPCGRPTRAGRPSGVGQRRRLRRVRPRHRLAHGLRRHRRLAARPDDATPGGPASGRRRPPPPRQRCSGRVLARPGPHPRAATAWST